MKRRRRRVPRFRIRIVIALLLMAVAVIAAFLLRPQGSTDCSGTARCFTGRVDSIADGDTLTIGGVDVRLALVDTPETGEAGYDEATAFTATLCPVGSVALVDQDDGQPQDIYGRMLAKVTCGGKVLNAELLTSGHAILYTRFCGVSEFAADPWTGC